MPGVAEPDSVFPWADTKQGACLYRSTSFDCFQRGSFASDGWDRRKFAFRSGDEQSGRYVFVGQGRCPEVGFTAQADLQRVRQLSASLASQGENSMARKLAKSLQQGTADGSSESISAAIWREQRLPSMNILTDGLRQPYDGECGRKPSRTSKACCGDTL